MLKFLEYIQSDGTNYIDLQYAPTINTEVETDLMPVSVSGNWNIFFGRQERDDDNTTFQLRRGAYSNNWYSRVGNGKRDYGNGFNLGTKYHIKLNKTGCTVDAYIYDFNTTTFVDSNLTMYIGGINRGGSFLRNQGWNAKYYDFIIRENGTEVKEYKPAELDGVVGYWETHSNTFLSPVGSAFIGGPVLHTFLITPAKYNFNETGESITAVITAETSWELTSTGLSYYTVSPTTGNAGSTNVTISVGANETYDAHNEDIVFTDNDGYEITFKARQKSPYQNSNIYIGETRINNIYIGDNRLSNIYYGENSIFN